jgi:pantoate--beta-alanine ligase
MIIVKKISQLNLLLKKEKLEGKKISFVPTMGALHDGHLALVKKAKELATISVVSIFVNKTQFNDQSDYLKYPTQINQDLERLEKINPDYVFIPDDEEIFSADFSFKITEKKITNYLCGATRNGHFNGVALIIVKLFNIVKPDLVIFGQKDFQQCLLIKKIIEDFNFDIQFFFHEIVRQDNGLAMSSRNQRLSENSQKIAANIFKILTEIKMEVRNNPKNSEEILLKKRKSFLEVGFEKIDYLEIRKEENLELINEWNFNSEARIFFAGFLDGVRLIDNLKI